MQIIINVPDTLPQAFLKQRIQTDRKLTASAVVSHLKPLSPAPSLVHSKIFKINR